MVYLQNLKFVVSASFAFQPAVFQQPDLQRLLSFGFIVRALEPILDPCTILVGTTPAARLLILACQDQLAAHDARLLFAA